MKSIMEEASTVSKAIETAWSRAGKPQEFSIKILEYPESSLFGLKTVKSAKIALLFDEHSVKQPVKPEISKPTRPLAPRAQAKPEVEQERAKEERPSYQERSEQRSQERPQRYQQRGERTDRGGYDRRRERSDYQRRDRRDQRDQRGSYDQYAERDSRDTWTPEMVSAAQDWLKETLSLMGLQDVHINPSVSQNYLKLEIDKHISDDSSQEETQLKSWGNLLVESIREKFNKPLRGLRVIIESRR
jgi:hypothetical protein